MTDTVKRVIIHRQKVPGLVLGEVGPSGMDSGTFGMQSGHCCQPLVRLSTDSACLGDERRQLRGFEILWVDSQIPHDIGQRFRRNRSGWHRPVVRILSVGASKEVTYHCALDDICRMCGEPIHDSSLLSLLADDTPQGLAAPRFTRYRPNAGPVRARFRKTKDAVFFWKLACRYCGPKNRGKAGLEGGDITRDTFSNQTLQCRHLPLIEELTDDLPVCTVPAQKKDATV